MAAALLVPSPADAATTVGQTVLPGAGSCPGSPDLQLFQTGGRATVATPGVLTSWSFQAGAAATTVTMRVYHQVSPDHYSVVADAGPLQTVAASSGLHTFPTRIPVAKDDIVGLMTSGGDCAANGSGGDLFYFLSGPATPVGTSAAFSANDSSVVDISASLEADRDADGYGDETQDLCPGLAAAHAACPTPATTITKKPKKGSHSSKSKVSFTSDVAGSTFTCALDGGATRGCTSPRAYFCLKPGKHSFTVDATSPLGLADLSPATARFKVPKDRHGC
jgi:hypothetical protein